MQRHLEVFVLACLFLIFILPRLGIAEDLATWPLGFPKSESDGSEVVTLDEARKIADYEARRTWGQVVHIAEIPCVGKNGLLVAYQIVFRLGTSKAAQGTGKQNDDAVGDSYSSIRKRIKDGRMLFREASKKLKKAAPEMNRRIALEEEKEVMKSSNEVKQGDANRTQRTPVSIAPTEAYKEAYEAREKGRRMMTGAGSYGTVLVTVREDLVPVPVVSHGLPPFFTHVEAMQQAAKKKIGGVPKISRIYMAGPLDQWFEFTTTEGKGVLVDPFRGQIFSSEKGEDILSDEMYMTMPVGEAREKRRAILDTAEKEISK